MIYMYDYDNIAKINIIILVYNAEKYIEICIDNQILFDIETLTINDDSTNQCLKKLDVLEKVYTVAKKLDQILYF